MNRLYIIALILVLLIVGCSDKENVPTDPTMATIGFSTQNIESSKSTYATIAEGTELQVIAFQRSSAAVEADVSLAPFRKGSYKVDGSGKMVSDSRAMQVDRDASYDFYVYSTDNEFQTGSVNLSSIDHKEHIMVGKKIGVAVGADESSKSVDFGDLEHLVSRQIILVRAASDYSTPTAPIPPTNVTSLVVTSVVQGKIATAPASFTLSSLKAGDAKLSPADALLGGTLNLGQSEFTAVTGSSQFESKGESYIIPAAVTKLYLTFNLEVNGEAHTFNAHDLGAPLDIFNKGYTYTFALEIHETSISLKLFVGKENPVEGWDDVDWDSEMGGGLSTKLGTWKVASWGSDIGIARVFDIQPTGGR